MLSLYGGVDLRSVETGVKLTGLAEPVDFAGWQVAGEVRLLDTTLTSLALADLRVPILRLTGNPQLTAVDGQFVGGLSRLIIDGSPSLTSLTIKFEPSEWCIR